MSSFNSLNARKSLYSDGPIEITVTQDSGSPIPNHASMNHDRQEIMFAPNAAVKSTQYNASQENQDTFELVSLYNLKTSTAFRYLIVHGAQTMRSNTAGNDV